VRHIQPRLQVRVLSLAALLWANFAPHLVGYAQDASATAPAQPRPRIGLVLAGGGAKGGAHIGVLKVLEQMHIPIDCIAGTSMGALVGGGYASGLPAADIESFVRGVNWQAVIGGVGRRQQEPIEQRRSGDATGSSVELGVADGGIITPAGLIDTSSIETLLRGYVARARLESDFNRLPIPFRAVATDMVTGKMVVFDHGDLATVMRASMSIPGAFAPVHIDSYILSDGFVVRNIPVDVARETCADVVIVVKLAVPPIKPEQLRSAPQLLSRTLDVMVDANEAAQLNTLTDRDVRIDVQLGDIGTSDFERIPETIPLGEAAARAVADKLARYSIPEADYLAWRRSVTTRQNLEVKLAKVRFEGLKYVNPEYLRTLTHLHAGDIADTDKIGKDAGRMASLDDLDSVAYRLDGAPTDPDLVWTPVEKGGGRDVLRPSVGVYAAGGGELNFVMGVEYVRRWLNEFGGQWRNNVQVGYLTELATGIYQPLDVAQTYFVEPQIALRRSLEDLYDDGHEVAIYKFGDFGGNIDLGANVAHNGQLRLGYWQYHHESIVTVGSPLMPVFDVHDAGIAASASYDSRDASTFASRGLAAEVDYQRASTALGGDRDYETIEGAVRTIVPVGKDLMWLTLAGGNDLQGNLPADRLFTLGGASFPGYQNDELRVGSYWTVSGSFLWRLTDLRTIKNQVLFAGLGLQTGRVYQRLDHVPDGEVYGASVYLGGRTPVGTLTLGVGAATDSWSVWVSLGRPIGKGSILDNSLFR
jgi:NTE family protein